MLACPLTFNSVNKFAHGHADCTSQLATHPAFTASLERLRGMGACVLFPPAAR